MDTSTFITRYQAGKRDFSWANLPQADLAGVSLADINLYRADLSGANLTGANLARANLFKANLAGANLTGANLAGANLRKANLRKANLQGAQCDADTLQGADWHGAILPPALAESLIQAAAKSSPEAPPEVDSPPVSDEPGADGAAEPRHGETLDLSSASGNLLENALDHWAAAVPPLADPPPPRPDPRKDPMAQREIVISMAHLGFGLFCFGLILGDAQAVWPVGILVWLAVLLGVWKEDLAWYVPVAGGVAVLLGVGISLGVMIYIGLALVGLLASFAIYGNIMAWSLAKSVGTALWFSGLLLIQMQAITWLFDGSNAYGGGGIVIDLAQFQVALLLMIGTIALGRGALGYLQLNEDRYPRARQWQYVGGSGAVGILLGMVLGWA